MEQEAGFRRELRAELNRSVQYPSERSILEQSESVPSVSGSDDSKIQSQLSVTISDFCEPAVDFVLLLSSGSFKREMRDKTLHLVFYISYLA